MNFMKVKAGRVHLPRRRARAKQAGIVLIDAMIAIVIFSIGILGMVALQGSAIEMTTASSYRINAAMLTDHVIAQMWASDLTKLPNDFKGSKGKGGAGYTAWFGDLDCTTQPQQRFHNCLPGVKANPPSIDIVRQTISHTGNTEYQVTVTVYWQAPSDHSVHKYVSVTAIGS
jgi:type IV pilus assembly protein PilV